MKGNITWNNMNCYSIHAETLRNKTNINDIKSLSLLIYTIGCSIASHGGFFLLLWELCAVMSTCVLLQCQPQVVFNMSATYHIYFAA